MRVSPLLPVPEHASSPRQPPPNSAHGVGMPVLPHRPPPLCSVTPLPLPPPQANAEGAVQEMLRDFARGRGEPGRPLLVEAEDFMDDGSPIRLKVAVDPQEVCSGDFWA